MVEKQFNYFSDPANGFTNGVVEIYTGSSPVRSGAAVSIDRLAEEVSSLGVRPGDLMHFYNGDGELHHAAVVSSVIGEEISYAGNSKRRFDAPVGSALGPGNFDGVFIVRIKDSA